MKKIKAVIKKPFTIDDLQTGMVITRRNGQKRIVIKDGVIKTMNEGIHSAGILIGPGNAWDNLDYYTKNLTVDNDIADELDIMKVQVPTLPYALAGDNYVRNSSHLITIWERK